MCGLVGMCGLGATFKDMDCLQELLIIAATRGQDSTGLMTDTTLTNSKPRVYKHAVSSARFVQSYRYDVLTNPVKDIYMGHTRWPTGSAPTTDKNAHPFAAGDLIGAHNGSLKGVEFYDKTLTDSELMIRTMAKEGIVPVLERLSVWDAYAVTIWDKTKKLLTVARNKERDLTFAVHKNKGVMFWASEDRYLDFVFSKYYKDDEFTYYDVTPYHVFTIDPKNVKGGHIPWITEKLTPKVRPKPEMKKVVGGTSTSTTLQKNQEYYEELYGLGSWDAVLINKGMNDEIPF